jgi:hypothetical protein
VTPHAGWRFWFFRIRKGMPPPQPFSIATTWRYFFSGTCSCIFLHLRPSPTADANAKMAREWALCSSKTVPNRECKRGGSLHRRREKKQILHFVGCSGASCDLQSLKDMTSYRKSRKMGPSFPHKTFKKNYWSWLDWGKFYDVYMSVANFFFWTWLSAQLRPVEPKIRKIWHSRLFLN